MPLEPFTLDHFKAYTSKLILDTGKPWEVEPFQLAVVADIFAGYPEVWEVVPEGNGKTTLMGGIALYHGDYTPMAEVLMAASSRDQAEILFRQAAGFVERTPGLRKRFKVYEGYRRIKCLNTDGRIQVFAADDRTGDGVIPTLGLMDELHRHRDLRLYKTWRGKLDKRGGQLVAISTAGEPGSEFELTRERIRHEAIDVERSPGFIRAATEHLALHDWSLGPDENVEDIAVVKTANPFSGITPEILKRRWDSPTMTMAHWRRFVCNLPTRVLGAAIEEAEWAGAKRPDPIPVGVSVSVGLDVAWKWDTTAAVPLYMPRFNHRLLGPASILTPPRDGSSLNPRLVEQAITDINERNPIDMVCMDIHRAEQLAMWIGETIGCRVIEVGQSNAPMGLAYERFMEGLRNKMLFHTGDPGLARHVANAVAKPLPLGGSRFERPSSSRGGSQQDMRAIDALIAAAMVHSICVAEGQKPKRVPVSF